MRRLSIVLAYLGVILALTIGVVALPAGASSHREAPALRNRVQLDITDLFAFPQAAVQANVAGGSAATSNVVLIMNVNPFAGAEGPAVFSSTGSYEFLIDTNGDAKEDITYAVTFSAADAAGKQTATIKSGGAVLGIGQTGATIALSNGGQTMAGLFDDPYFFDNAAYQNGMRLCQNGKGTNFYYGANINAIILDLPSSAVGTQFGVWARTMENGKQVNRAGLPALNALLIGIDKKDAYSAANPADDARVYTAEVVATLKQLGHDDASAAALAKTLLPDVLQLNLVQPSGFDTLNGRRLADDTVDTELALVTRGRVTTDCVASDSNFRATFPYLAPANPTTQTPGLPNTGTGGAQSAPVRRGWALAAIAACLALAAASAAVARRLPRR